MLCAPHPQASGSALWELVGSTTGPSVKAAKMMDRSASAAYFNPAMLVEAGTVFEMGLFVLSSGFDISLFERPGGVDISDLIYGVRLLNEDGSGESLPEPHPLATSQLPERLDTTGTEIRPYLSIGLVRSLVPERLSIGFHTLVPTAHVQAQNVIFSDEREQYFSNQLQHELYGDRLDTVALAFALGGRVTSWLSLGMGVSMDLRTDAVTPVFVPDGGDQSRIIVGSHLAVESRFTPHFSLVVGPIARTHLTFTFHEASGGSIDGENQLKFWSKNYPYPEGEDSLPQVYKIFTAYQPRRASLGLVRELGGAPGDGLWRVGLGFQWTEWSNYINRLGEAPLEPWDDGLEATLSLGRQGLNTDWCFSLQYVPSPVPDQVGRTNYVDSDRWSSSMGVNHQWNVGGVPMIAGANIQAHWLVSRETNKVSSDDLPEGHSAVIDEFPDNTFLKADTIDKTPVDEAKGLQTNNPGYPGYRSKGWALGVGVTFKVPF
jgi:hypothetical protein